MALDRKASEGGFRRAGILAQSAKTVLCTASGEHKILRSEIRLKGVAGG